MSSTFTLKDWTVYSLSDETAAPSFDAATQAFTLSPSLTDTAPIVYEFYDNIFDIGKPAGQVTNDLRFDLKLNLANNSDLAYSDIIVDAVTMHPVNVTGDSYHPTLAHFHPATNPSPQTLTQATGYRLEQDSSYAATLPNINGATRAHLYGNTLDQGGTESWTAAKVHHWDGVFALVITPTPAIPYGDVGGRLQGLNPAAPADGTQFAYENVVNQHSTTAIAGTARNDLMVGSDGDSTITGGAGRDTALGRAGNDVVSGEGDSDFLYGQKGLDTLSGGDGNDIVDGGADADSLDGGTGDDLVMGGAGNDTVSGSDGNDTVDGGLDDDSVRGDAGGDLVSGGYGNDMLYGNTGADTLYGNFGDDSLFGGADGDRLLGGEGNDRLNGNGGNDELIGGFGQDTLNGSGGDDTLYGAADADLIVGDGGRDFLSGGEGADRFDFNFPGDSGTGAARDVIEDFLPGTDRFDVAGIDARAGSGTDNDAFTYIGSNGFSGVAGQLRYENGVIQADRNGDRTADFEVELLGAPALQAGDLIL